MSTLAELLTTQSTTQVFQYLLSQYQAAGFPVQSWQTGGVERTRMMATASALVDLANNYVADIAAGGFLDYAGTDWLRLLASQNYSIDYNKAVATVGSITLTNASANAYTITAGQLVAVFGATGHRYINSTGGVLGASSSLTLSFTAEFAGAAYADASNSGALTLATPLPGVTLTNPAGSYTTQTHVGSGAGTLTLGGSPVGNHYIVVTIVSSGDPGVATWSYSLDGASSVNAGAVSSLTNIGGYGINVTLVGTGSGYSFVAGDTYAFGTPGSWITTVGADDEANTALASRCKARWPSLSSVPTKGYYQLIASSEPTYGAAVQAVIVVADTTINNKVNVVCAGPTGALPPAAVTALDAWVKARSVGTDFPVVSTVGAQSVTLAGTITVPVGALATAQAAIQTAMSSYVSVAGVGINGTVKLAVIAEKIMAIVGDQYGNVTGLTINGAAADLVIGTSSTFYAPSLQALGFGYVTV